MHERDFEQEYLQRIEKTCGPRRVSLSARKSWNNQSAAAGSFAPIKKNIKPRCYCHCQCLRQCHKWQNDPESVLQYGTPSPSSIPSRTPYVLVSRFPWSVPCKTPAYDLNQDVWCRVAGGLQGQVFG